MTTKRFSFDTDIERGDDSIELRVVYSMTAGSRPQLYGDYPHPGDPDEYEIISALCSKRTKPIVRPSRGE